MANEAFTAGLLHSGLPGEDPVLVNALEGTLRKASYQVDTIDLDVLCDPLQLTSDHFDLLVIPHGTSLPPSSMKSVESYLRQGGNIIALKTPLWEQPLINLKGEWVTAEEFQLKNAGVLPEHVVFDFTANDIANWERSTNRPEHPFVLETVPEKPAPDQRALHVVISDLDGWDTHGHVDIRDPFPEGHTLTVFSAKGGPRTAQAIVEWQEKDESRWIATISLSEEWKQFVLPPKAFRFWQSNPKRGFRGDIFQPQNAKKLNIGVAFSHTGAIGGRHEFWIGPFGTAATAEYQDVLDVDTPPALDTLSPSYKFFECRDVRRLHTRREQTVAEQKGFDAPRRVRSSHPRPGGGGFDKGRDWRWISLIEATTRRGEWRGTPATLLVHSDGPYKGGVWAGFAVPNGDWYLTPEVLSCITDVARRMRNPVFIIDGGTKFYTHFEDQPVTLGIRAVNLGDKTVSDMTGHVTVHDKSLGVEAIPLKWTWPLTLAPGEVKEVSTTWKPEHWPRAGYRVTAEILQEGNIIDRVVHETFAWKPGRKNEFVTVGNGDFILQGKRWRSHGVNYMPSSGLGTEDNRYFEDWLGARSYHPEVIERDLRHVVDLGFNAVSIFIDHRYMRDQNLLDLLRRLEEHGLKANLSLRPGTPMDYQGDKMRDIIEYYRLAENDTVFAYDLAWEPMWWRQKDRQRWDRDWEAWVIERYGSIGNAEKDWRFPIPRDENGRVTNPSREQTDDDGEWRGMVAAYRRFLDFLLYKNYSAARQLVRSIDPHHMVSFRMSNAGDPTHRWDGIMPYDFPYLVGAVDILEPEAYGRIGDWEKVKPGWFEFEYARWAAPHLPMMWAEMGVSAWDRSAMRSTEELLEFQAQYYRDFYRMLISSGADGIFFWWYPGGYRWNEVSDFGIINPDGSDRPVTEVIRKHARKFVHGPSARRIDYWIEFDRDAYADGMVGVYDAVKDEFWKAIGDGRAPGLRTLGTGTNSASCPPTAVGNVPWDGNNPPKYLDAAFDAVEVLNSEGRWEEIEKGGTVKVPANGPVLGRMTLTNLGEAEWITKELASRHGNKGAVYLVSEGKEGGTRPTLPVPISTPVPRLGSVTLENIELIPAGIEKPTHVVLTMLAEGRTGFGEQFTFTVEP